MPLPHLPLDAATACSVGGGKRDRTADLLHAMQALSQLSYTPLAEQKRDFKQQFRFRQELLNRFLQRSDAFVKHHCPILRLFA